MSRYQEIADRCAIDLRLRDSVSGWSQSQADRAWLLAEVDRLSTERDRLADPDFWEQVADRIGKHDYTYDLGDDSHRLDVVQIVCGAARAVLAEIAP